MTKIPFLISFNFFFIQNDKVNNNSIILETNFSRKLPSSILETHACYLYNETKMAGTFLFSQTVSYFLKKKWMYASFNISSLVPYLDRSK